MATPNPETEDEDLGGGGERPDLEDCEGDVDVDVVAGIDFGGDEHVDVDFDLDDDIGLSGLADVLDEVDALMEESSRQEEFLRPPTDPAIVDYGRVTSDEDAFLADCIEEAKSTASSKSVGIGGGAASSSGGGDGASLFLSPEERMASLRLLNEKWRVHIAMLRRNADEAVRHAEAIATANDDRLVGGGGGGGGASHHHHRRSESSADEVERQRQLWEEKLESLLDAQATERDDLRRDAALERRGRVADLRAEASAERDAVREAAEVERADFVKTSDADRAAMEARHFIEMGARRDEARREIGEWVEKLDEATGRGEDVVTENAAEVRAIRAETVEVRESWIEKLDDAAGERSAAVAGHASEVRSVRSAARREVEGYRVKLEAVDEDVSDMVARHGADVREVRASARRDVQDWQAKLDVAEAERLDLGRGQARELRDARTAARKEAEEFTQKLSSEEQNQLELASKHSSEVRSHSHKDSGTSSSSERAKAASQLAEEIDSLLVIADFKGTGDLDHEGETKDGTDGSVDNSIELFYEKLNEYKQKLVEAAAHCGDAAADADRAGIVARQTMETETFRDSVEAEWDVYQQKTEKELTDLMTRHANEIKALKVETR